MRRISTSIFPFNSSVLDSSFTSSDQSEDDATCQGRTVKLHTRVDLDQIQVRKTSTTMPLLLPSRRQSVSARSTTSTSSDRESTLNNSLRKEKEKLDNNTTPRFALSIIGESDYSPEIPLRKKSAHETGKLPSIRLGDQMTKTNERRRKKSKTVGIKNPPNLGSVVEIKADFTELEGSREDDRDKDNAISRGEKNTEVSKYILDLKRNIGWDVTRPFTFSYFPKVRPDEPKKKKSARKGGKKFKSNITRDVNTD